MMCVSGGSSFQAFLQYTWILEFLAPKAQSPSPIDRPGGGNREKGQFTGKGRSKILRILENSTFTPEFLHLTEGILVQIEGRKLSF
jgi:hypothetical protein